MAGIWKGYHRQRETRFSFWLDMDEKEKKKSDLKRLPDFKFGLDRK